MQSDFFEQYPYLCDTFFISKKTKITKQEIDAEELISPYRFDFMAKLLWLDSIHGKYDRHSAQSLYEAHLLAFSNYLVVEPGQSEKKGLDCYYTTFQNIHSAVSEMNDQIIRIGNPIPVDGKNMPLDGAHRISTALYFNKRVEIYRVDKMIHNKYDFLFFRKRCLHEKYLLEMVEKYISMHICRLYCIQKTQSSRSKMKKVYNQCAPVYIKKMKSGEWIVILDGIWSEKNGGYETAEQLLGNRFIEGQKEIASWIEKNRVEISAQKRWYKYSEKWKVFFGKFLVCLKRAIKRLLRKPN